MTKKSEATAHSSIGVISTIRGLTVEVQVTGEKPDNKELLAVEGYPEVFLEVNFFVVIKPFASILITIRLYSVDNQFIEPILRFLCLSDRKPLVVFLMP